VIHVGNAGRNSVEGFERAHERAGWIYLDFDTAAGRNADRLRQTNRAGLKPRRPFGPVGHHLQLAYSLRDRGRREAQGRAGRQ
jgi:hypothetical protein